VSTIAILAIEIAFFAWYLWPPATRTHPFLNGANAVLILKYSSIYGIAAIGAAMVIIAGGIDLAPGAVIALSGVVTGGLFVGSGWNLASSALAGFLAGTACGLLTAALVVAVGLPPFIATLGVMGIARGAAFIITEGRYFDVSSRLPADWRPLGLPIDWTSPLLMVALLGQKYFGWGSESVRLLADIKAGRPPASPVIDSGVDVVTAANVDEYMVRWNALEHPKD
jgi:ribose/xylose/arabinose/galactoside ABC-type transport system permease subunit